MDQNNAMYSLSPKIVKYEVYPVAGYDSMAMTLSGAHSPYFTRNIIIMEDSSGNVGLGEIHGGENITESLRSYKDIIIGSMLVNYKEVLAEIKRKRITKNSEGIQYLDISKLSHVVEDITAVESAYLDLLGKHYNLPVCSLLGEGKQRDEIPVLGYMFFVSDIDKTDLPYIKESSEDVWFRIRRNEMLDCASIIKQAKALEEKYGFKNFKLKGGVLDGEIEMDIIKNLKNEFPSYNINIDPNGAWSLEESIYLCNKYKSYLSYVEDPCSGEYGYSGRELLSELRTVTGIKVATNMIATDWRQLHHSIVQKSIDIVLADPHFWTMSGSIRASQVLNDFRMTWGSHSNNHFDISLAMFVHTAASAHGNITPMDTHWIWQDGQNLCIDSHIIEDGNIEVGTKPGLGITIDMDRLKEANNLYNSLDDRYKERDDSIGMQYLIPNWKYDNKKPCLVR